jgi:hypothetical protein
VYRDKDGHVHRKPAPSNFCLVRCCFAQVRRAFTRALSISDFRLLPPPFHVSLPAATPARCPTLLAACSVTLTSARTASPGARVSCAASPAMERTCGRFAVAGPNLNPLASSVSHRLYSHLTHQPSTPRWQMIPIGLPSSHVQDSSHARRSLVEATRPDMLRRVHITIGALEVRPAVDAKSGSLPFVLTLYRYASLAELSHVFSPFFPGKRYGCQGSWGHE